MASSRKRYVDRRSGPETGFLEAAVELMCMLLLGPVATRWYRNVVAATEFPEADIRYSELPGEAIDGLCPGAGIKFLSCNRLCWDS